MFARIKEPEEPFVSVYPAETSTLVWVGAAVAEGFFSLSLA
jgi:hypothetical protein